MKPKSRLQFFSLVAWSTCALTFGTTQSVLAADGTWTGGPAAIWDTSATNWSGVTNPAWDGVNGPSNIAIFNTAAATPAVSGTVFANGITFSDTATVSGGTITLDGTTPTITTDADATIASALAGTAGLVKAGAEILVLSSSIGYSGTTTINGGTLALAADNTAYIDAITATGTLRLDHPDAAAGSAVTLNSNSTLDLRSNTSATFNIGSFPAFTTGNRTLNLNADRPTGGGSTDQVLGLSVGFSSNKLITCNVTTANGYQLRIPLVLSTAGGGTGFTLATITADTSLFLHQARSTYTGGSNPALTFIGPGNIEIGATGVTATNKQLIGIFNQTGTVTLNGPWAYAGVGTSSQINSGTVIFKNNNLSGLKIANIGGGATPPVIDNQSGANITNLSGGGAAGTTTLKGDFTFGSASTTGTLTLGSGINGYNLGTIEETTRTITVAGLATNQLIISKPIADGTNATTPTIHLTKEGVGILTLSGASSYTGATTINAGTLALTGSLTASSVEVKDTATLSGNGNIGGDLTIRSGAHHALNVAANDGAQVPRAITGTLTLDSGNILDLTAAVPPAGGTYVLATATGGITGTPSVVNQTGVSGVVSVDTVNSPNRLLLTVASDAGYASWIALFPSVGGQNQLGDDPDNDGMDNVLEFVLNGDPTVSDSSILPKLVVTATDFEFTYQRRDDSVAPETTQTFQWGTTLATWPGSAVIPATSGPVGVATITVSPGTPDDAVTDTVKVSIPKIEAGGSGKLFGRLEVSQP